jgi:hypothetical protein
MHVPFGLPSPGGDYHSMALAIKERMQSRRQTERSKFDYAMPNAYLGLPTRQAQASLPCHIIRVFFLRHGLVS